MGYRSDIFAEAAHTSLASEARPLEALPHASADGVLYHLAIRSHAEDAVVRLDTRRALVYHNLTPARWFRGISRRNYDRVAAARRRLPDLATAFEIGIALSEFSRTDLLAAGFARTVVCPPAIGRPPRTAEDAASLAETATDEGPEVEARSHGTGARPTSSGVRHTADPCQPVLVLGVGRVAPNKRWDLAVRAMATLRREIPTARMDVIGSLAEMERYASAVARLSARLNAAVHLRGTVSDADLEAAFQRADVLLHPSAHEGFGLPLLEAMAHGLPVVATARAAIPEVVGDAGLLCSDDPLEIAEALRRVLGDDRLRAALVRRGRQRAAGFDEAALARRLAEILAAWGIGR